MQSSSTYAPYHVRPKHAGNNRGGCAGTSANNENPVRQNLPEPDINYTQERVQHPVFEPE